MIDFTGLESRAAMFWKLDIAAVLCWGALVFSIAAARAEGRVALVIGNTAYQNTSALANPANDADDMAAALKRVGFTVFLEHDVDKPAMERSVARFARAARGADTALVYYAGHAMQYRGLNYLVPVDAKLEDEFSLNFELTRLDDVLLALNQASNVRILILDACRNNPLAERLAATATTRDFTATRGLARLSASRGMVVAYSTQPDQVALDGAGRNSPFTAALVKQIDEPGLEIGTLFRRVAADVNKETNGRQLPELSISLLGEFYFSRADSDIQAWSKARASDDPAQLKDFLNHYPSSPLVTDAHERLEAIERVKAMRLEQQRLGEERLERERLAQEQADRERLAREQAERERVARDAERKETQQENLKNPPADIQIAKLEPPPPPPPVTPVLAQPLPIKTLVQDIKAELARVGCYSGKIDDKWASAETKLSVQNFVKYAKLSQAPEAPVVDFLDAVRGKSERVCPLGCTARQVEIEGRCVVKSCAAGQRLDAQGNCIGKTTAMLRPDNEATPAQPKKAPVTPTLPSCNTPAGKLHHPLANSRGPNPYMPEFSTPCAP